VNKCRVGFEVVILEVWEMCRRVVGQFLTMPRGGFKGGGEEL